MSLAAGEKVYFKAHDGGNESFSRNQMNFLQFGANDDGDVPVSGNVMSLVDPNCESTEIPCEYCFYNLFGYLEALTDASELKLPATTLKAHCYENMFAACGFLKATVSELPAMKLEPYCYYALFSQCNDLEAVPELPAENLVEGCYGAMFASCYRVKHIKVHFSEFQLEQTGSTTYRWMGEDYRAFTGGEIDKGKKIFECPTALKESFASLYPNPDNPAFDADGYSLRLGGSQVAAGWLIKTF